LVGKTITNPNSRRGTNNMEKNRWSLIFIGLCLALVFSVSSVEAADKCEAGGIEFPWDEISHPRCDRDGDCYVRNNNRCISDNPPASNDPLEGNVDCDDGNPLIIGPPPCGVEPPPTPDDPPEGAPIIATVGNKFHTGTATGYITSQLFGGIYTNVRISTFNKLSGIDLHKLYDVLHIQWSTPSSLQVSWKKLEDFMLEGGGILFEDPQNVIEIEDLGVKGVEHHAETDVVIVEFVHTPPPVCQVGGDDHGKTECYNDPEEILSAFTALDPAGDPFNLGGYFLPGGSEGFCLNFNPLSEPAEIVQTLGLGYGCLNNNHMTFKDEDEQTLGLTTFLELNGEAVGLYGEFPAGNPTGRILFTGPDHSVHAQFVASPFHANAFCLLTNELIWLSQLPVTDGSDARLAMDNCVENAEIYRDEQGQLFVPHY